MLLGYWVLVLKETIDEREPENKKSKDKAYRKCRTLLKFSDDAANVE